MDNIILAKYLFRNNLKPEYILNKYIPTYLLVRLLPGTNTILIICV